MHGPMNAKYKFIFKASILVASAAALLVVRYPMFRDDVLGSSPGFEMSITRCHIADELRHSESLQTRKTIVFRRVCNCENRLLASTCPSVHMEQLDSHRTDIREI